MRKYGLPILVLFAAGGQLLRTTVDIVSFKQVAFFPSDTAIPILAGMLLLEKLRTRRLLSAKARLFVPISLFVLAAMISLVVNIFYFNLHRYEIWVSSLYLLRWVVYCIPYFLVVELVQTREHIKRLLTTFAVAVSGFTVFGIYQAIFLPNFAQIVDPLNLASWDVQYNRLVSTFLDPNFAGCLIGMALVSAIAFWMEGISRSWYLSLKGPYLIFVDPSEFF